MPYRDWGETYGQFIIEFGERVVFVRKTVIFWPGYYLSYRHRVLCRGKSNTSARSIR